MLLSAEGGLARRMRAEDVSTEDGGGTEDGVQRFSDGNIRSFTVTADAFCELRTCNERLVEDFPININRLFPCGQSCHLFTKKISCSAWNLACKLNESQVLFKRLSHQLFKR